MDQNSSLNTAIPLSSIPLVLMHLRSYFDVLRLSSACQVSVFCDENKAHRTGNKHPVYTLYFCEALPVIFPRANQSIPHASLLL